MANFTFTAAPQFPQGTEVAAYAQLLWAAGAPQPGDAPRGPIAAEALVDNHGFALLENLEDNAGYFVGASVNGEWRWKTIYTPASSGAGTGLPGKDGAPGVGLPVGGTAGQVATKKSSADYDVQWSDATGGLSKGEAEALVAAEALLRSNADALKAPLVSPALTGVPTAPTASSGTNTTQLATTAFVQSLVVPESITRASLEAIAVTSKIKSLGAVAGDVIPDLGGTASNGPRVFKCESSGAVALRKPINSPTVLARTEYIEVEVEGDNPITFPDLTGWRYGSEPPQNTGAEAVNRYAFYSDDHWVTYYGVGSEGLPDSVVQVTGQEAGETVEWDGSGWQPVERGLTKAEVDARIAALSILTGGHPMTYAAAPTGAGQVAVSTSGSAASYLDLVTRILEIATSRMATHAALSESTVLDRDTFYPAIKAGITLTMPEGELLPSGTFSFIRNDSGGTLKLKGKWTPGTPALETTIELSAPGLHVFRVNSESVWAFHNSSPRDLAADAAGVLGQSVAMPSTSEKPVSEKLHLAKIMVPNTTTISKVFADVATVVGVSLTAGYAAIYDSAGNRLAQTAPQKAAWETEGSKEMALEAPVLVQGGPGVFIYVALLAVGTTTPAFASAGYGGAKKRDLNAALSASALLAATGRESGGTQTFATPPATIDPTKAVGKAADVPLFAVAIA